MKQGFYSAVLLFALCSFIGHNLYTHRHHELILSADEHHHHSHQHHGHDHQLPHSLPDSDLDHDLEFGKILFKTQPVNLNFSSIQYSPSGICTQAFIKLLSSVGEISRIVIKPDKWYLSPSCFNRISDRAPPIQHLAIKL